MSQTTNYYITKEKYVKLMLANMLLNKVWMKVGHQKQQIRISVVH